MSDNGGGGYSLWTIVKVVLMVVGFIYLATLITWFAQWATVLLAIGGVGYLGYRVAQALGTSNADDRKLLAHETPFDKQLRQLEEEERLLDHKIGL